LQNLVTLPSVNHLLTAVAIGIGGIVVGGLLHAMLARFERNAEHRHSTTRTIVFRTAKNLAVAVLGLGGLWLAVLTLGLSRDVTDALERAIEALAMVVLTVISARLGAAGVRTYFLHRAGKQASSIFVTLTWVGVVAVGMMVLLQTFGVSITPLLTALGVAGLAVALALQDTLSNLFAGIHILASKKVQIGDFIELDTGQRGYIVDITWRNTAIRQLPNNMLLVPNSRLATAVLVNYYRPAVELAVLVEVGVSYDSDLGHVERVTAAVGKEVMQGVSGGVPDNDPFIRYHTFNQSSIDFTVILRAREFTDQYLVKHEFIKRLHARYREEGIQIPFPIRTVVFDQTDGKPFAAPGRTQARVPVKADGRNLALTPSPVDADLDAVQGQDHKEPAQHDSSRGDGELAEGDPEHPVQRVSAWSQDPHHDRNGQIGDR
jgi:small-conductance mechanosensitive channel